MKSHLTLSHNQVLFSSYLRAACQFQCLQSIPPGNLPLIVKKSPICDTSAACCEYLESDMRCATKPQ